MFGRNVKVFFLSAVLLGNGVFFISGMDSAKHYFSNLFGEGKTQLPVDLKGETAVTPENIKKIFGYDPQDGPDIGADISKIKEIKAGQIPVIFSHGAGHHKFTHGITQKGTGGYQVVSGLGDVVVPIAFNYSDYGTTGFLGYLKRLKISNWGQEGDVIVLLAHIVACYKKFSPNVPEDKKIISGFGHSRGGAVWIGALSALALPKETVYKKIWKSLGFDLQKKVDLSLIGRIRAAIKRGRIFIATPLLDIENVIQMYMPNQIVYSSVMSMANVITKILPEGETKTPIYLLKQIALLNKINNDKGLLFQLTIFLSPRDKKDQLGHRYDDFLESLGDGKNIIVKKQSFADEKVLAKIRFPAVKEEAKKDPVMVDYHNIITDAEDALLEYLKEKAKEMKQ